MFKKIFAAIAFQPGESQVKVLSFVAGIRRISCVFRRVSLCFPFLVLAISTLTACRTVPLPPANLAEPGWVLREGQAVWRPNREAPELAGDILLATNISGRTFVQFTKTPFPLVIVQSTTNSWQIEAPSE